MVAEAASDVPCAATPWHCGRSLPAHGERPSLDSAAQSADAAAAATPLSAEPSAVAPLPELATTVGRPGSAADALELKSGRDGPVLALDASKLPANTEQYGKALLQTWVLDGWQVRRPQSRGRQHREAGEAATCDGPGDPGAGSNASGRGLQHYAQSLQDTATLASALQGAAAPARCRRGQHWALRAANGHKDGSPAQQVEDAVLLELAPVAEGFGAPLAHCAMRARPPPAFVAVARRLRRRLEPGCQVGRCAGLRARLRSPVVPLLHRVGRLRWH